jgi:hypothetical protein
MRGTSGFGSGTGDVFPTPFSSVSRLRAAAGNLPAVSPSVSGLRLENRNKRNFFYFLRFLS